MPYPATPKTWVAGDVLTAAQLNAELRDALLGAFPLGPPDGAWTSYTPTLTQSATVTKTVTYAKYMRVGRLINVNVLLAVTGTGTAANQIIVGLPVTAATSGLAIGSGFVFDQSANFYYTGVFYTASTTTGLYLATSTNGVLGQAVMAAGLATPDTIGFTATYESAT